MNGRQLDPITNDIWLNKKTLQVQRTQTLSEKTTRLIGTILRTVQGESFVDYDVGIPWFDDILGRSVLFVDEMNAEIKDKIKAIPNVANIEDLTVEINGRNVSGKYKVTLTNGEVLRSEF